MTTVEQLFSSPFPQDKMEVRGVYSSSRIINPGLSGVQDLRGDFTLRDKTKLLMLADRIETTGKKTLASQQKKDGPTTTTPVFITPRGRAARPPQPPATVSLSRRPAKFYSSFSSSKPRVPRTDPAKTNIEHLVRRNSVATGEKTIEGLLTPFRALHASFHDKAKLASAFSPRGIKLFHSQYGKESSARKVLNFECRHPDEIIAPAAVNNQSEEGDPQTAGSPTWRQTNNSAGESPHTSTSLKHNISNNDGPQRPAAESCNTRASVKKSEDKSDLQDPPRDLNSVKSERGKRSRSLPKSYISPKYGGKKIENLKISDKVVFERLEDRKSSCPNPPVDTPFLYEPEPVKMRMGKSVSEERPKSLFLDNSERNGSWRVYRDIENEENSPKSPKISGWFEKEGRIDNLHSSVNANPYDAALEIQIPHRSTREPAFGSSSSNSPKSFTDSDTSAKQPSLFKRFSKTFSIRFGSRGEKLKETLGSTPDLSHQLELKHQLEVEKQRKERSKTRREEKCKSGDSGIQIDLPFQISGLRGVRDKVGRERLRKVRSEYIPSDIELEFDSVSAIKKLSFVEIPDREWKSTGHKREDSSETDSRLDGDDGFVSENDEEAMRKSFRKGEYINNPPKGKSEIRGKVIREILATEQNYVKTLNDIVQGFLIPCRGRKDLFSEPAISNIFSNVEQILALHARFLEVITTQIDKDVPKSRIGPIFLAWASQFDVYSEYCCNNPISNIVVRKYSLIPEYANFFEACRRLQMMDKLPLHGFLLRPIQRICQYHLQLNELLKYTDENHADFESVVDALEAMKKVATKINDTQRKFDNLQEIVRVQNSIEGFEGRDLIEKNTSILIQGELIKTTEGHKSKDLYVILLNKELIYCKKDFLKRNGLIYGGRIDLDFRIWLNIDSNEEDECFGMVHNSWRIYSEEISRWLLFTAASPAEKRKWMAAMDATTKETRLDEKMKEMAKFTVRNMPERAAEGATNSNTLPKSKRNKKETAKLSDSESMLIDVSRLKQRSSLTLFNQREKTSSKFYV